MAALVQKGQYGAINMTDTVTMGYYVIKFMSELYILQEEIMCNLQISTAGGLVVKVQNMNYMKDSTTCN